MNEGILVDAGYARLRRAGGFWRRQFDAVPTPAQRTFDVVFGIVAPVLCFAADPIIFRGGFMGDGPLCQRYQLYAYTVSAVEIVALCAYLCGTGHAGRRHSVLGGMLLAGGAFSFALGLLILPFSLFGLLVIIGIFGFVPFLTAVVYLRNGWRAVAHAHACAAVHACDFAALACGFAFALGAPAVAHATAAHEARAAVAAVREGRELTPAGHRALRFASSVSTADRDLLWDYRSARADYSKQTRIAEAFREMTGEEIEERLTRLAD